MTPPRTEDELLTRALALGGRTLRAIATDLGLAVPEDLRHAKGWIGGLLETALGATGGSVATWDFPALRVEMKTVPVDALGKPRESTFVCVAPLGGELLLPWRDSWLRGKLARVLWVPVAGAGPPGERQVGRARLWSPSPAEEAMLRADWDELTDLLGLGHFDALDARWGTALQVRPKAADGRARTWAMSADAEWVQVNPRGFYLRAWFTRAILATTGGPQHREDEPA